VGKLIAASLKTPTARQKMDKAILRKEKDIVAMKDRLVQLRFDTSQSPEELQRNVKVRTNTNAL